MFQMDENTIESNPMLDNLQILDIAEILTKEPEHEAKAVVTKDDISVSDSAPKTVESDQSDQSGDFQFNVSASEVPFGVDM